MECVYDISQRGMLFLGTNHNDADDLWGLNCGGCVCHFAVGSTPDEVSVEQSFVGCGWGLRLDAKLGEYRCIRDCCSERGGIRPSRQRSHQ